MIRLLLFISVIGFVSSSALANQGYREMPPASDTDGVYRVLLYHDMEGLAGQSDWRTYLFSSPKLYELGRTYLMADINAVVEGLIAGGVDEVHVVDAHGSGNPDPDVVTEKLHPRASQIIRDKPFRAYADLTEPGIYDAVAAVGMHSKTGSGGFAAHTYTLGIEMIVNHRTITESEIIAFSWGRAAVPLIFVSGDDKLEADLRHLPWIEYARVKYALAADKVELVPVDEARQLLHDKAKNAARNLSKAKAIKLVEPIHAALKAYPPASLEAMANVPGINYSENRVDFVAPNFEEAYNGLVGLVPVATLGFARLYPVVVANHPDKDTLNMDFRDFLFMRWADQESSRLELPKPTPPPKRYHGSR